MPQKMKKYERRILEAIIENADKSIRSKLYCQYKELSVVKREFTGVGFYIYFELPDPSYAIADLTDVPILRLGGIAAEIKGLKHGADFILYVKHGVITMLEGYSFDEKWPFRVKIIDIKNISDIDNISEKGRNRDKNPGGQFQ